MDQVLTEGMLASADIITAVSKALSQSPIQCVVDPVSLNATNNADAR